jgi:hypothetical protein
MEAVAKISKRVSKFRNDVVDNSEKYTSEMTPADKHRAYQGWALELAKHKIIKVGQEAKTNLS